MNVAASVIPSRRRALRRAVRLECQVQSAFWDGEVDLLATDVSPLGLWLDCPLPLEPGESLRLAFRLPGAAPFVTGAEVARAGLLRRRNDSSRAGMGLSFTGLPEATRDRLAAQLRGLPPPLPGAVAPPMRLGPPLEAQTLLVLDDGNHVRFVAEAPLVTAYRLRAHSSSAARTLRPTRYVPREERLRDAHGAPLRRRRLHVLADMTPAPVRPDLRLVHSASERAASGQSASEHAAPGQSAQSSRK